MNLKIIKRKKLNEHETVYDIFVQFLAPSRKKKSNLESSRLLNRSCKNMNGYLLWQGVDHSRLIEFAFDGRCFFCSD